MAIFNGKNITVEITGESHASEVVASVKGFPKIKIDNDYLAKFTARRKASKNAFSTPRIEPDQPIFSGVTNNELNGDFTVTIKNTNVKSGDYNELYAKPRPSHADLAWYLKDGALNFSGGGRFSARLTAPLCVVGGIAKQYLEEKGVYIGAYLQAVGKVQGKSYLDEEPPYSAVFTASESEFPSLNKKAEMLSEIESASQVGDSVGGVIECIVYGLKAGVGDNLFEGLEGKIASLLYSVPAVKGVEFGAGFSLASKRGSQANDQIYYDNDKNLRLKTNNNGGINGGISNGQNVTMRVAIKPTPSIFIEQETVDLVKKENVKIKIRGRHDSCVAVRGVPCIESVVALAILDEII